MELGSRAPLPLDSYPSIPRLTQAQEGGGTGQHGPAPAPRAVLEFVSEGQSLQATREKRMWWLGALSGVSTSTASHKGEELSLPSHPRFPLTRQRRGLASKRCLFPLCTDEAELISRGAA